MNLISREDVRQARPEWRNEEVERETEEATVKAREFSRGWNGCLNEYIKNIKALSSAFEGMTNGDVLKAIFPDAVVIVNDLNGTVRVVFSDEVWDSPYKG